MTAPPGPRERVRALRRLESGGRRSLGCALSTPDSGVSSADLAQPPQPARSRRAPALQPLFGNRALCRRRRGDYKAEDPQTRFSHVDTYGAREIRRGFISCLKLLHFSGNLWNGYYPDFLDWLQHSEIFITKASNLTVCCICTCILH
ncbi:LOW QUALITY PROTEIN: hypothetical protein MC885_000087, partial [Smutsia gigantea]